MDFLLLATFSTAQAPRKLAVKDLPPSAFKLISIKVSGSNRFSPNDVIAATGLRVGETATDDDFKTASRHLADSGAFSNVAYNFVYSTEGTTLGFDVTDAALFAPAQFDNFVWLSDQELRETLHTQVPLFQGELPLSGDLPDQVSAALQTTLALRHIPGQVDYLRAAHNDGPIEAFVFSVKGVNLLVRNIDFTGALPAELPSLQAASTKMLGQDYSRSILRTQAEIDLLAVYLTRGYLKAKIDDAQAKVIETDPEKTTVDVTFPVNPGRQYKLTGVQWSGNQAFPAQKLQALIREQVGQPLNLVQFREDLDNARKLYGTLGYMTATLVPGEQFEEAQAAVSLQIEVHEGDVYRMGDLEIRGLDSRTTAQVTNAWKLRGGDPYDSSYPTTFLEACSKELSQMGQWNTTFHETHNQKDRTVDVSVRFDPASR